MKPDDYPVDPPHLWEHFYRLTQIPRPSRQEEAVRRYTIEQAESGLAMANLQLDETTIKAPFDGVIAELYITEGL